MRFEIPQFIKREARIVGPLTFKQSIFFGIALVVVFILYFTLAKKSVIQFLLTAILLVGTASFLAFGRIQGKTILNFVQDFFSFTAGSKIYLWKRKEGVRIIKKEIKEIKKETPSLRVTGKSLLKGLLTKIETKTK